MNSRSFPRATRRFPRAEKAHVDGYKLDSKAEARRYGHLRLLEKAGRISDLEVHPYYDLVVNGMKVSRYTVDFRYRDEHGRLVVEDVKGGVNSDPHMRYVKLKIRLVKAIYGHDVTLVHP